MALNGGCHKYSENYDIVLNVENNKFYLQKQILRQKSAYFEAMFGGSFADACQQEVTIEMISATSMTFVVDYLYNKIVEIDDLSIVVERIEAAMFFQIAELVDSIVDILKAKISFMTWAKILQIAKAFNLDDLERKARCFGLFHFNDIRKNIDCVDNVVMLHWYLSHVYLKANSEYDIFETGCDWLHLNNIDSPTSVLVILSCLHYKTLDKESLEKILYSDLVSGNDLARRVIQSIMEINSQEVESVTSKKCASFLQNVNKSVSDIVIGFLTLVKERVCVEQPLLFQVSKDTLLKKFHPKNTKLDNWLLISNEEMCRHNLMVWRGFHIIFLCGECVCAEQPFTTKGIWKKNILKFSILEEKWTTLNSFPVAPLRDATAVIHEDSLYIIGGVDSSVNSMASVRRYDLLCDTWHTLPNIPNLQLFATPVAAFHNGELYVSATMLHKFDNIESAYRFKDSRKYTTTMLYVFCSNQWVHMFTTSRKYTTIISFRDRLYLSHHRSQYLHCWETKAINFDGGPIEFMMPNEELTKKSKNYISSTFSIGESLYLLTTPSIASEHFGKQAYFIERCHLEDFTLETEIVMEREACLDYSTSNYDCLVIPNLNLEERSINDFGKRWLDGDDFSNGIINLDKEDDANKTNRVLKVINSN